MAKAPQAHIDRLRIWLQFNDELCKIHPDYQWKEFKEEFAEEDWQDIINHCENEEGRFELEYYFDYYQRHISYLYGRILMGYEVLVDNACDPKLDYLDFKPEIKKLL